jgi:hypothetical protein
MASGIGESLQVGRIQVQPPGVRFQDEVGLFLADHQITYVGDGHLVGRSGVRHRVDFLLRNGRVTALQAVASEQSMRRSLNIL